MEDPNTIDPDKLPGSTKPPEPAVKEIKPIPSPAPAQPQPVNDTAAAQPAKNSNQIMIKVLAVIILIGCMVFFVTSVTKNAALLSRMKFGSKKTGRPRTVATENGVVHTSGYSLQGIIYSENPIAMINNIPCRKGDKIGSAEIREIAEQTVLIIDDDEKIILKLD